MKSQRLAIVGLALSALMPPPAQAAEIKAFISGTAGNAFDGIVPLCEHASGQDEGIGAGRVLTTLAIHPSAAFVQT